MLSSLITGGPQHASQHGQCKHQDRDLSLLLTFGVGIDRHGTAEAPEPLVRRPTPGLVPPLQLPAGPEVGLLPDHGDGPGVGLLALPDGGSPGVGLSGET